MSIEEKSSPLFFLRDEYYDSFEEMMAANNKWLSQEVNDKSINHLLNTYTKQMLVNLSIRDISFSNQEMIIFLEKVFMFFIKDVLNNENRSSE